MDREEKKRMQLESIIDMLKRFSERDYYGELVVRFKEGIIIQVLETKSKKV